MKYTIDEFTIVRHILNDVYEVKHNTGDVFILKVVFNAHEIFILKTLQNVKNVIQMSGWFRVDENDLSYADETVMLEFSKYFITEKKQVVNAVLMEKLENTVDLYEYLNTNKNIDLPTAKHIFHQILSAIYDCFKLNIIHFDIKDENVLINKDTKQITIIDFGSARFNIKYMYHFKDIGGTPRFYPPELLHDKQCTAEKLTVYTLGWILYLLVFNNMPWSQMQKLIVDYSNMDVPKDVLDLLYFSLHKNDQKRFTIEEMINHPWFQ